MKGNMDTGELMKIIRTRRSVSVYKGGKISDTQMEAILEAARWAPSERIPTVGIGVTRNRTKMKRVREIYDDEWRQRKREDPVNYKGLKKDYVGMSVLISSAVTTELKVYLTTRQPGDREKLFQASVANACNR